MKWFFAINETSLKSSREFWEPMILTAVRSAARFTHLEPHLIFDGGDDPFLKTLENLGVKIVSHRVSFYDNLAAHAPNDPQYLQIASGAFLRVEIPLIEQNDEYILYTDCDVLFQKEVDLSSIKPSYFACAPEFDKLNYVDFNTGVMLMNLPALRRDLPTFVNYIKENLGLFLTYDQCAFRFFYKSSIGKLPVVYNWKPYWGPSQDARIVHFHGPKPSYAQYLLKNPDCMTVPSLHTIFHWNAPGYSFYVDKWEKACAGDL